MVMSQESSIPKVCFESRLLAENLKQEIMLQSLEDLPASADEGHGEGVLFNMMFMIGGGEDFGFVDVVYTDCFEDLPVSMSAYEVS
jgi:hypothetical protein